MSDEKGQSTRRYSTFSLEMKVASVFLVVVGILGVVFGARGMFANLRRPFLAQLSYSGPAYLTLGEREAARVEQQKQQDTDGDGLNDYDELNVYRTSPYLIDTDSDGVEDGIELTGGADPTCPEGQVCDRGFASATALDTTPRRISSQPTLGIDTKNIESVTELGEALASKTPAELRVILESTGIEKSILDGLSDADVVAVFQLAFTEAEESGVLEALVGQLPDEVSAPPVEP